MVSETEPAVSPDSSGEESRWGDICQVEDDVIAERVLHHLCTVRRGMDRPKPLDWIIELGGQGGAHHPRWQLPTRPGSVAPSLTCTATGISATSGLPGNSPRSAR